MTTEDIIKLNNVSIYQQYNLILSNVNFKIQRGEFVYLIGRTGSGKTSLLRTLYADLPLRQGNARVVGFQLEKIKRKDIPFLRRKLGIVFQDYQLLTDRSIKENLTFVMKATGWKDKQQIELRIRDLLDKIGLPTKEHKMPHELSGGEQQSIVIARALINNPEIILADEPTGNLDPETSEKIIKLLFNISKSGPAVFMATHNYSIIEKFPARILKCENGRIVENGSILS